MDKNDLSDTILEVGFARFLQECGESETPINNNNYLMNRYIYFKRHLISAANTFVSTFLVSISLAISITDFPFTREALLSVGVAALMTAVRALAKLIIEWNAGR